jgi:hypothetical protein
LGLSGILFLWWLSFFIPVWGVAALGGLSLVGFSIWARRKPLFGKQPHVYWIVGITFGCVTSFVSLFSAAHNRWVETHKQAPSLAKTSTIQPAIPAPVPAIEAKANSQGPAQQGITPEPKERKQPKSLPRPKYPKMLDLFLGDFPGMLKIHGENKMTNDTGGSVTVTFQLYLDYSANSKFVGYFIPTFPDTYQVCKDLSSVDPESVAKGIRTYGGIAGQTTEQKDLVFTGRVYLYHESELSIEQRASLIQVYRSKHLDVQFRGYDYFVMQNLAK